MGRFVVLSFVRASSGSVSNSLIICGTLNLSRLMRTGCRLLPVDPLPQP